MIASGGSVNLCGAAGRDCRVHEYGAGGLAIQPETYKPDLETRARASETLA